MNLILETIYSCDIIYGHLRKVNPILYVLFSSVRPMVLNFRNFHYTLILKKSFLFCYK